MLPVTNDTVKGHSWPNCYNHAMASSVLLVMWVGNICATDTTVVIFAEFSFVCDYIIYALGKAHIMHSIPSLGSFPNVAFETVLMFIWYMMAFLLKTCTHIFGLLFFVSCQIKHHSSFKLFVIWSWTMTKHWVKIWLFSSDVMAMKGLNNLKPSKITFVTGLVY